jgi:adenosylcobinamide-GDP ribazoletransferase
MKGLRGALGFLTILPVGKAPHWQGPAMLPWFPVAGFILGLLWVGCDVVLGCIFPSPLRAALDMVFIIVLTGGLHLDGLADTADGLLSHRGREEALRIMKDSQIGTWGVLALVSVLALKGLALYEIILTGSSLPLILVPAFGRVAMLVGIAALPYGRGEEGIAHKIFELGTKKYAWIPGILLLGLGCILLLAWPGPLVITGTFALIVALILGWYRSRLGCITGDMLGALGEVAEAVVLLVLAVEAGRLS